MTPYPDVDLVVRDLLDRTQTLLGGHFVGMYLVGSLALGGFVRETSGIDYIVVTDASLAPNLVGALRTMHEELVASDSPWAGKCEVAYAPREALCASLFDVAPMPQAEKEMPFFLGPPEPGWAFQCHTLRQHGVVVAGPAPESLLPPIDASVLRQAAVAVAQPWIEQRGQPDWLRWMRTAWAFVVLTLCRLLYTLETGDVVSKAQAGRWARQVLDERFRPLVESALSAAHGTASTTVERQVVDFIAYTAALFTERGLLQRAGDEEEDRRHADRVQPSRMEQPRSARQRTRNVERDGRPRDNEEPD